MILDISYNWLIYDVMQDLDPSNELSGAFVQPGAGSL
jgi:hypothetical protein